VGFSTEVLTSTIAFWQPQCNGTLTDEDARQIVQNVVGYFDVLVSWDRRASCDARPLGDAGLAPVPLGPGREDSCTIRRESAA
jgi:hypothetical protein